MTMMWKRKDRSCPAKEKPAKPGSPEREARKKAIQDQIQKIESEIMEFDREDADDYAREKIKTLREKSNKLKRSIGEKTI